MAGLSGANQLADVARAARLAGEKFLPDMRRGMAKVGPPARKAVKASALAKMPKGGGYAATLARTLKVSVNSDTGFTTAGVMLKTYAVGKSRRRDVSAVNRGILRHPVYGRRRQQWVAQKVASGFWDDAMDQVSDQITGIVRGVMDTTAARLMKG